jgi:hypothetical protein
MHRSSNEDSAPSWIIENGGEVEVTGACAYSTVHDQLALPPLTRSVRHVTSITPCHATFTALATLYRIPLFVYATCHNRLQLITVHAK